MTIESTYRERHEKALLPLAKLLQTDLEEWLADEVRIDRISTRAKSVDRFLAKASKEEHGRPKYAEPLHEIQDQIGARVIVFYQDDVDRIEARLRQFLKPIEFKMMSPESEWTFGYFGRHFVFLLPNHLSKHPDLGEATAPHFFELQIKTLFQHAWSEANHDLGYKPGEEPLDPEDERALAYASAQAWGADKLFIDLFRKRHAG